MMKEKDPEYQSTVMEENYSNTMMIDVPKNINLKKYHTIKLF